MKTDRKDKRVYRLIFKILFLHDFETRGRGKELRAEGRIFPAPGAPTPFLAASKLKENACGIFYELGRVAERRMCIGRRILISEKETSPNSKSFFGEEAQQESKPAGLTTIHPFQEGCASLKWCKTASDLPRLATLVGIGHDRTYRRRLGSHNYTSVS